jgi:hypothetical protein
VDPWSGFQQKSALASGSEGLAAFIDSITSTEPLETKDFLSFVESMDIAPPKPAEPKRISVTASASRPSRAVAGTQSADVGFEAVFNLFGINSLLQDYADWRRGALSTVSSDRSNMLPDIGDQETRLLLRQARDRASGQKDDEALCQFGLHLKSQGLIAEALTAFRLASEYSPDDADIIYNLGITLLEAGYIQNAVKVCPCLSAGAVRLMSVLPCTRSLRGPRSSRPVTRTAGLATALR